MKKEIFVLSLAFTPFLFANGLKSEKAINLANELHSTINQSIRTIEKYESEAGAEKVDFTLRSDDQGIRQIGMLVDIKTNRVIAITPGGIASQSNIEVNDEVLSLKLDDVAVMLIDDALANKLVAASEITFVVNREGKEITLNKSLVNIDQPIWQLNVSSEENSLAADQMGCGFIRTLQSPKEVSYKYPVIIQRIDGKVINNRGNYQLSAGMHKIQLHESINDRQLLRFENRSEMRRSQTFEIEIQPNTVHYLAAKFIKTKDRIDERKRIYWEPVIWKTAERVCQ